MPASFNRCVAGGGRVRRVTGKNAKDRKHFGITENQYLNVCIDKKGNFVRGEVHSYAKVTKRKS